METLTGLIDHMVLQRNARGVSQAAFVGRCAAKGSVRVRVLRGGKPVRGFRDVVIGKARGGTFKGLLQGLPTGGPYQIQLAIVDRHAKVLEKLTIKDVLVGDVWVAAGQSNMLGRGLIANAPKSHPMVRAFFMDDRWGVAKEPVHEIDIAVDGVHRGGTVIFSPTVPLRCAGPAIGFALAMHALADCPQGIIASAHGGTSMTQWSPDLKGHGGKSLYGATLRRCNKNGQRVAGIIWYQGESDAETLEETQAYTDRMKRLIAAFRRDLRVPGAGAGAALPVVIVQIGRAVGQPTPAERWNNVQEQQRRLPTIIKNISVVPAIDLDLDDLAHIAGSAQQRLGSRMAYAMNGLVRGPRGGKPPIMLRRVSIQPTISHVTQDLVLEFDNVEGRLTAGDRPTGFSLCDQGGVVDAQAIYRIDLAGNKVILRTRFQRTALDDKSIHYGLGTDPICNITDTKDRGLLVMGPIPVAKPRALTEFVQSARLTGPLPAEGNLRGLAYPDVPALAWRPVNAEANFLDIHAEVEKLAPADNLYYFRCRLHCPQEMKLAIHLGYDGPAKLWVDGQEKFTDPKGTNPATAEKAKVPFVASQGSHEIVVALGTNNAKAWGIFLRFERRDLSPKVIALGPGAFALPTIAAD